jgi:hypothetical protein
MKTFYFERCKNKKRTWRTQRIYRMHVRGMKKVLCKIYPRAFIRYDFGTASQNSMAIRLTFISKADEVEFIMREAL